jgi:hypothetical protein
MPSLRSYKPAAVTYLDEIDDEDVLRVVRQIRRRGNLPDIQVVEERPHVVYSLDGEIIGAYKVEINTDAASIAVDIDSASAVASPARAVASTRPPRQKPKKKADTGLPAPRYTYNESLQEDMLEDFYLVRYKYEGESESETKKRSTPKKSPKKSPERRRKSHRIMSSAKSPKRAQTQLGLNLLCGCLPAAKVKKPVDEPDGPPSSELRRSMNSIRNEVSWLYDDMLGSESDSEIYGPNLKSKSSNKEPKADGGSTTRGLMRLWAGLGEKKVDDYYSADDSSSDDNDNDDDDEDGDERDYYFDVDDLESEMGSLTVASTDSSILAAEDVSLRRSRMGLKSSKWNVIT